MITLSDYWMGRDATHGVELTDKVAANATLLLGRVNLLLAWAYRDGVQPGIDADTGTHVASGWRPAAVNAAVPHAASNSRHMTGEAIDLRDTPARALAIWCLANEDALDEIGLWMERPQWTPTWVHLQNVAPGSNRRYFIPSTSRPLVAALPGELEAVA